MAYSQSDLIVLAKNALKNWNRPDPIRQIGEVEPIFAQGYLDMVADNDRLRAALAKAPLRTFDQTAADALADEVNVLVRRKIIDSRSPAADALLSYRDPPASARGDRMATLEYERDAALAEAAKWRTAYDQRGLDYLDMWETFRRTRSTLQAIQQLCQDCNVVVGSDGTDK